MISEDREPIHTYFGLSYSSHLVVDPARTTRLPQDQQDDLARMLDQLQRSFPDVNRAGDEMLAVGGELWECGDLGEEQMRAAEMSTNDDLDDHSECEHDDDEGENWCCERDRTQWYDWRGDEHDRHEMIVVPTETVEQARAAGRTVVSRTLLQSMPADWQARFVALAERLDDVDAETPENYDIQFYTADGHRTTDPIPHYSRGRTRITPTVVAG